MINVERIEKSIENINGLLMDFQEAVYSLRKTRELLYEIIESYYQRQKSDTDLDMFVKDCIVFKIAKFVPVKDVWHRYLKYFGYIGDDGNPDEKYMKTLTQCKFTRYLKRDYMARGLTYKLKKINNHPVLCFLNIELVPDREPRWE